MCSDGCVLMCSDGYVLMCSDGCVMMCSDGCVVVCPDVCVLMCSNGWCSDVFRQVLFWWCPCTCVSCDVVKYTSYTTISRMQSI